MTGSGVPAICTRGETLVGYASLTRLTHQSFNVIASEAKQSNFIAAKLDCFVASAPLRKRFAFVAGNDELGIGFNCQTARGRASALSRRDAPELCVDL